MMTDELSGNPILDAELLRAFVAFAAEKNFTRASRRVGLSQPALFERVQRLAEAVGRPLYIREGRTLTLTPVGIQMAAFARDSMGRARSFLDDQQGRQTESVILAAGEGAYLYLLGQALLQFKKDPKASLQVMTLGGPLALEAVASGEAHVAVGVYDLVPKRMVATDILHASMCAALHRGHRLAKRRTVRLTDLAGETLIVAPEGQRHRDLVGRAIANAIGTASTEHVEADGWPLMLAFAAAGLGVAVVNSVCRPPAGVVLVPLPELGTVSYRAVRRRDAAPSAACDRLVDLIAGHDAVREPGRAR